MRKILESIMKTFFKIRKNVTTFLEKKNSQAKLLLLAMVSLFAGIILTPKTINYPKNLTVGMIARTNIHSPTDILVQDEQTTKLKMAEAEASVPPVFDYISNLYERIDSRLTDAFNLARERIQNNSKIEPKEFNEMLNINLSQDEFKFLLKNKFSLFIEKSIKNQLRQVLNGGYVTKDYKVLEGVKTITVRFYYYNDEGNLTLKREAKMTDLSRIVSYDEATFAIKESTKRMFRRYSNSFKNSIIGISQKLLEPNLIFNMLETENRKQIAKSNVKPVLFQLKRGEIIVREGERIDEETILKLNAIQKSENKLFSFLQFVGTFLLFFILGYTTISFAGTSIKKFQYNLRNLIFLSINFVLFMFLLYFSNQMINLLRGSSTISVETFYYLIPVGISGMVIRTLLNSENTFIVSGIFAIMGGLLLDNNLNFAIYTFAGCLTGANFSAYFTQRSILIKAGVKTGIVNMLLVLTFNLMKTDFATINMLFGLLFGFISGILSSIIATGLIPIFESIFGYATDMKLLELINVDHPLMRELSLKAPGTYHHSVMVSALAESAARAIGANPIVARVGAYYHDIGKLKLPQYYIENQFNAENKHNTITPRMSSIIIFSHVKEGVEMAIKHRLPDVIRDIIAQHHGTSLIKFFFEKAKEMPGAKDINESDYRYPGPKPQTKEAGIIMLADTIEAAARTLKNPSVPQLQHMVERLIGYIFSDGQLVECMLTLKDLHEIGRSFVKVLAGFTHQRIDYPIQLTIEAEKQKENGNSSDKEKISDKSKQDKKDSDIYFKKIGLS